MSTETKIIAMAQDGVRRTEIAKAVGCSVHTVYDYVCKARREGVKIPPFKKGSPKFAQVTLPNKAVLTLRRAARARNITPSELAERLLAEMHNGTLIAAILDDGVANV